MNEHLETRMFLVGNSVTVADITVLAHLAGHFVSLSLILLKIFYSLS